MMDDSRLSKATLETRNKFQCFHNNIGYCKYKEHCQYQHYTKICPKTICRDLECKFRHPRTCKHGQSCKFLQRKCCLYKHETFEKYLKNDEVEKLRGEVLILKEEIQKLKRTVEDRQQKLKEIAVINTDKDKIIAKLTKDNDNLKKDSQSKEDIITKLNYEINAKDAKIHKMKLELRCDKCELQTESLTAFLIHLSKNHTAENSKQLKCDKCKFQCSKEKDLKAHKETKHFKSVIIQVQTSEKHNNCDKCDFKSATQFDLLLHKSTKHPL